MQPELAFQPTAPEGLRLTNEFRAELIAQTGHDIAPDDPIMALVVLSQILLPRIARSRGDPAESERRAAEALAEMRKETLRQWPVICC
jgi:hypothetical protein